MRSEEHGLPVHDIPKTLRELASQVESGEVDALGCVLLFQNVSAVFVYGMGPEMDDETTLFILQEGVDLVERMIEE